jgi:acetyl-CoA decarbonylase/synthase complex subunit delta
MALPAVTESWSGVVNEVTIGATAAEGGTRTSVVKVGGAKALPFHQFEGEIGNKPVIAAHIVDTPPEEWPEMLRKEYEDVYKDVGAWARKCVDELGVAMIALSLDGIHPDKGNLDDAHAVEVVKKLKDSVGVPLIIWGCGFPEKDNAVLPKVSQALKGERALLGSATQDNYKTIAAVALADGHNVIAEAPIDINIGKQVNILLTDMDFPLERVVMFQTTGALGYGLEYVYSIQERERLAALGGDRMMAMPMLATVGHEAWRAKEAKAAEADFPEWGPETKRGPMWEIVTAMGMLISGGDIMLMRHPQAIRTVSKMIDKLYG